MSQHINETQVNGRRVQVVLGYDRPLNYFFLTVQHLDPPPHGRDLSDTSEEYEDDEYLYTNLSDPRALRHADIEYYRKRLIDLKIAIPESMFEEVSRDADSRVGNRVVHHLANGEMTVRNT